MAQRVAIGLAVISRSPVNWLITSPSFAEAYATANAQGLFNSWYEKPAMLRLLGVVAGQRILEPGYGSGPTSVAVTERGADVSGFDLSVQRSAVGRVNAH